MSGNSSPPPPSNPPPPPPPPHTAPLDPPFGSDADWEALGRLFAGESSDEETARLRRWLDEHPGEAAHLAALEDSIQKVAATVNAEIDVEAALSRVHARQSSSGTPASAGGAPRVIRMPIQRPSPWRRRTPLLAAAALACVALGIPLWRRSGGRSAPPPTIAVRELTTGVGQRDSLLLADGTRIIIGPLSHLALASDYGTTTRSVELRGEGFFDVRHDPAHPFVARVGRAVVSDLGTTFTVQSIGSDDVRVVVTSGQVRLGRESDQVGVVLGAGDVGRLHANETPVATKGGATEDDLAWTRGRLAFRETPLSAVVMDLKRWYGIEVRLADSSLAKLHVTTNFERESGEQAIRIIALAQGLDVEMHADTAVLRRSARTPRSR